MFKKLIIVLEFRKTKECDRYYFFLLNITDAHIITSCEKLC